MSCCVVPVGIKEKTELGAESEVLIPPGRIDVGRTFTARSYF